MKILVLGSTGQIGTSLVFSLMEESKYEIFGFARKLNNFDVWQKVTDADVIINCVGVGDPAKVAEIGPEILNLTGLIDRQIMDYLIKYPNVKYINFSSGVVNLPLNLETPNYYQMAKIYSEVRHRSMKGYLIVDLRLYGFFSQFIDLNSKFFLAALVKAAKNKEVFKTDFNQLFRDYIGPKDLSRLINICIYSGRLNRAFDVYSFKPANKFEILEYFKNKYNLKVDFVDEFDSPRTANSDYYFSSNRDLLGFGYTPKMTAMQTIIEEASAILE
jgi:nucleoside-diphosphate-sugar epimerase